MPVRPDLDVELVPIELLIRHPANPRRGDMPTIVESLRRHGFYGTLVVQRSTNHVLAGNHRWLGLGAARDHVTNADPGWEEWQVGDFDKARVHWADVDDDEALELLAVDNRSGDLADYDDALLAPVLERLRDLDRLESAGWQSGDLDDLLRRLHPPDFDAVEAAFGEHTTTAPSLWPVVRLLLPPDVHKRFTTLYAGMPGANDADRIAALVGVIDAITTYANELDASTGSVKAAAVATRLRALLTEP